MLFNIVLQGTTKGKQDVVKVLYLKTSFESGILNVPALVHCNGRECAEYCAVVMLLLGNARGLVSVDYTNSTISRQCLTLIFGI